MINEFKGKNYFLSNFFNFDVVVDEVKYKNNEAAFQAAKIKSLTQTDGLKGVTRKSFSELQPNEAKRLGRQVKLRIDWEDVKDSVMLECVRSKFSQEPLRQRLIDTGSEELIEGNTWNDRYWGVDLRSGSGENKLGKILMQVREELLHKGRGI